jgi:hypothetical protein
MRVSVKPLAMNGKLAQPATENHEPCAGWLFGLATELCLDSGLLWYEQQVGLACVVTFPGPGRTYVAQHRRSSR